MEGQLLFIGGIVHSLSKDENLSILQNGAILVENGQIKSVVSGDEVGSLEGQVRDDCVKIKLRANQFLCPGFVDTHIHACQYPNMGLGYDRPLLDWLNTYTFPLEKNYANTDFAQEVYSHLVKTTLSSGTTTACYYATIHTDAAIKLAEIISTLGQRALVGKVNMNQNSPDDYIESTNDSLRETERFICEVKNLKNDLVLPAVTPRFAISCDMGLLKDLGDIAKKYNCHIQTHISENKSEVEFVRKLYPNCKNYTDVYDKANLLTDKTILGHGIYLSEEERDVLSARGVAIAHCADSNTLLQSGICNVRNLWNSNVKVGLGTDVSGGSSASILEAIRSTLAASIHLSFNNDSQKPLTYHEAFYLATLGGAQAMGMGDTIGNFVVGKDFDALLVEMDHGNKSGVFKTHSLDEMVQKFIYTGDDRNIKKVFVRGKLVKDIPSADI